MSYFVHSYILSLSLITTIISGLLIGCGVDKSKSQLYVIPEGSASLAGKQVLRCHTDRKNRAAGSDYYSFEVNQVDDESSKNGKKLIAKVRKNGKDIQSKASDSLRVEGRAEFTSGDLQFFDDKTKIGTVSYKDLSEVESVVLLTLDRSNPNDNIKEDVSKSKAKSRTAHGSGKLEINDQVNNLTCFTNS